MCRGPAAVVHCGAIMVAIRIAPATKKQAHEKREKPGPVRGDQHKQIVFELFSLFPLIDLRQRRAQRRPHVRVAEFVARAG